MLRSLLRGSGFVALLLGTVTILELPIDPRLCAAGVAGWWTLTGAELCVITSAHKRFTLIRISSDGDCELADAAGRWQPAKILAGSVVLNQLAWLRLQPASGWRYHELVRGKARESKQWRRLQVIWRHLGTVR